MKRKLLTYSTSTALKLVPWGQTSTVRIAGKANSIDAPILLITPIGKCRGAKVGKDARQAHNSALPSLNAR